MLTRAREARRPPVTWLPEPCWLLGSNGPRICGVMSDSPDELLAEWLDL
jgi:hypothetical protein